MNLTKRSKYARKISSCVALIAMAAFPFQSAYSQAEAPITPSNLKVRTYANVSIAHGFYVKSDLTGDTYGGRDVSYEVLDKSESYQRVRITSAQRLINPRDQEKNLEKDGEYYIAANAYQTREIRDGLVTGLLAVPFKYHFTDHAVSAGATIGAYVGYEKDWNWIGSAAWIVGGGLALVPVSTTTTNFVPNQSGTQTTTSTSDSTLNGITIATGLIGRIGQTNAQFGVLLGTDLVNKSQKYKYDGKPWLSFSFAYAFSGNK